jgi:UDP-N-acetylglucosamine acyltransferase
MPNIHPTAVVDPRAELGGDVEVGPYSVIGPAVRIGKGTKIGPHAVVEGNTTLGEKNVVFQFATVGSRPQDLKYKGEDSRLIVGDYNTIREYASLNPGTAAGGMVTQIGDHNLLMMYCHIAHDCRLGNYNIVANGANLAGHVVIEDYVVVGALVGIHQFVKVGTGALLGAGSMVSKDVVPHCSVAGDRARLKGLNLVGLRRRGVSARTIEDLKRAYRILFRSGLRTGEALDRVRSEVAGSGEVRSIVAFVEKSRRGVCR